VLNWAGGAQAQTGRADACASLNRELVGVRALLAADDLTNQMMASELLSRLGIELDIATNGRAAVDMASLEPDRYAAVFMDRQMPEIDGLAARRLLRVDPQCEQLPIIAMTAKAMKAELDACLAA
jgi:two-component system, sensor histidine kinase and response regulator